MGPTRCTKTHRLCPDLTDTRCRVRSQTPRLQTHIDICHRSTVDQTAARGSKRPGEKTTGMSSSKRPRTFHWNQNGMFHPAETPSRASAAPAASVSGRSGYDYPPSSGQRGAGSQIRPGSRFRAPSVVPWGALSATPNQPREYPPASPMQQSSPGFARSGSRAAPTPLPQRASRYTDDPAVSLQLGDGTGRDIAHLVHCK